MERFKPVLAAAGYSAWFGVLFSLFVALTFPWSKVSEQITVAAADKGVAFHADSLRPAVVGARAKGLLVGPLMPGEGGGAWLQAESLRVKSGVGGALSALLEVRAIASEGGVADGGILARRVLGALGAVDLQADMYGDEVSLRLADESDEAMRLDLKTGRLDLAAYPIPGGLVSGPPKGRLLAEADVLWHWEDAKKSSGSIDLNIDGLELEGLRAGGLTLPTFLFDRAEAHVVLAKGRAEFRNTAFEADKGKVEIEGFINLKPKLLTSTYSLRVKFKIAEGLEGLLSVAGLKEDSKHRDSDGWFHYQVQGRLPTPRFTERRVAQNGAATSSRARGKVKPGLDDEDTDPDEEGMSPQERSFEARKRAAAMKADEDENEEPLGRNTMSEERRQELEQQRADLREQRLQRREERRKKREELMEARRQNQEAGGDVGVIRTPPMTAPDDFVRTNDPDEGVDEEDEEFDPGPEDGEFDPPPDFDPDAEYEE